MLRRLVLLGLMALGSVRLEGAVSTYWVDDDGAATSLAGCQSATALSGASACSLATLKTNIGTLAAGDTVYLRAGSYTYATDASLLVMASNGTLANRITISAYQDEVPVIEHTSAGTNANPIDLNSHDYFVIRGITFKNFPRPILVEGDSNEIDGNTFYRDAAYPSGSVRVGIAITGPVGGGNGATNNWVHDNIIHDLYSIACDEGGDGIKIGGTDNNLDSHDNTIEDNVIYNVGHTGTESFTLRNVWRNNFIYNPGFKAPIAAITGTATGGSTTTLIDTAADFSSLASLITSCFDTPTTSDTVASCRYAADLTDPGSGFYKSGKLTGVSTTTNPNDTLTFSVAGGSPTFAAGHSYSISCKFSVDDESPGDGKYSHRGAHLDTTARGGGSTAADLQLWEGNRIGYTASNPGNAAGECLALSAGQSIVRYSEFYGCSGAGLYFKNGDFSSNNRVYGITIANTGKFAGLQFTQTHTAEESIHLSTLSLSNKIFNSIFWDNPLGDYTVTPGASWTVSTNIGSAGADPKFTNYTFGDYDSRTVPDLSLQSDSPARDAGTHLTSAVGAGASTTTLVVADSLFFQDGTRGSSLSNIQGDWIAIGAVGNIALIASIDYDTHTITLATPKTWSDDASIWLYSDSSGTRRLYGSAPDIGAHEFNSADDPAASSARGRRLKRRP